MEYIDVLWQQRPFKARVFVSALSTPPALLTFSVILSTQNLYPMSASSSLDCMAYSDAILTESSMIDSSSSGLPRARHFLMVCNISLISFTRPEEETDEWPGSHVPIRIVPLCRAFLLTGSPRTSLQPWPWDHSRLLEVGVTGWKYNRWWEILKRNELEIARIILVIYLLPFVLHVP